MLLVLVLLWSSTIDIQVSSVDQHNSKKNTIVRVVKENLKGRFKVSEHHDIWSIGFFLRRQSPKPDHKHHHRCSNHRRTHKRFCKTSIQVLVVRSRSRVGGNASLNLDLGCHHLSPTGPLAFGQCGTGSWAAPDRFCLACFCAVAWPVPAKKKD